MHKKSAVEEAGEQFGKTIIKKIHLKYKGNDKTNFYKGLFSALADRERIEKEK